MGEKKGGRDAAFFLFLFAVAVFGLGGSLQYPLAVLRAGGFGAAIFFLWKRGKEPVGIGVYSILVGGFVLLSIGHSFSSVYIWVSLQHALNIALAAVLLAWAVHLLRKDPGKGWDAIFLAVAMLALAELGIALFQHLHGEDLRPRGTFDNANYLSEFLAAASILCSARLLWNGGSRRARIAEAAGGLLFLAAGFSLASSRGVLLASVPAFGTLLVARYGFRKGGALLAGIWLPALGLLGYRVAQRFFWADVHNYSRWIIWKSALRTFLEHPFGVGLGGFKYYWFANQSPVEGAFRKYGKFANTAHSEYLEVLSGLGGFGFLLFLAVLVVPLLIAVRRRHAIPADRRGMAAGAAGVLVLSGAHALFNSNFHVYGVFFLDAAMLGALLSCLPGASSPAVTLPSWAHRVGMAACAGLLAATVSTAAGVWVFDRGERFLRSGDLAGAERSFRLAAAADPFRSVYPDALSAVCYRKYLRDRSSGAKAGHVPESFYETFKWEDRARSLNPRELQYTRRLSDLFLELFRLRGAPSDAVMSFMLAGSALRINPYSVEALWRRAEILVFLGRREEAALELETAVSVEPNFCRGYATLAENARTTDPAGSSRWSARYEECRRKAATLHLEEYEKWLLESPEGR
jgi:O-antigen ligase